jgi:hypothetical protein
LPRNANETAAGETPAAAATSSSVTRRDPALSVVLIGELPCLLRVARGLFSEELLQVQSMLAILDKAPAQRLVFHQEIIELSLAGTTPDASRSRP